MHLTSGFTRENGSTLGSKLVPTKQREMELVSPMSRFTVKLARGRPRAVWRLAIVIRAGEILEHVRYNICQGGLQHTIACLIIK